MNISKTSGYNLYTTIPKSTMREESQGHNQIAKQGNNRNSIEISISNEGLSRQLAGQHTLSIGNKVVDIGKFKDALNGNGTTTANFAEFTDSSLLVDRSGGKLVIRSDDSQSEKYRKELLNVTSLYGRADGALGSADEFNSLSSKYMELRKGIEEKYSNEELTEQLKLLDDSYDVAVNTIAEHTTFAIKSSAKIYEMAVKANNALFEHGQAHGHTFGIPVKDRIEYDKDALNQSVSTLIQNVQNSIKNFGLLAKQYMLDGNNPTDKNAFENYISQGFDENKGLYSLDDVDMLKSIFEPISGKGTKSNMYSALDKLENSSISDSLKAAVVRMATQTDRMFSVVSDDSKEMNDKLSSSMLSWEKSAN